MAEKEFFQELREEVAAIFTPITPLVVSSTTTVPNVEDTGFTLAAGEGHKAKTIKTCVLFIDIRNSTQLNFKHSNEELAKLYSAFIVTMLRAAEYYGGYVRNINGDRVMVVFDEATCFLNALKTATLLNTVAQHLLDAYFKGDTIACGIGIDYGSMLVVKTGTVKRGKENQFYKSFVWLGKPANLASKLTDLANKETYLVRIVRRVLTLKLNGFGVGDVFDYRTGTNDITPDEFLASLTKSNAQAEVQHGGLLVYSWSNIALKKHAILLTQEVYEGLVATAPTSDFIVKKLIEPSGVKVKGYTRQVFGTSAFYPTIV
ncbi:MAG: adenylate/guanylate cyclase domain-containing protein [Hymenobacter sp.]|nr:MAG: adenylate/guanylate cyclase domain-containing protein [Hymenobacter sp.]